MQLGAGIVEGFYGDPWTWAQRHATLDFMRATGLRTYLYAPKRDRHLRKSWRTPHEAAEAEALADFAGAARARDITFGIGLSPFALHADYASGARALQERVEGAMRAAADLFRGLMSKN